MTYCMLDVHLEPMTTLFKTDLGGKARNGSQINYRELGRRVGEELEIAILQEV